MIEAIAVMLNNYFHDLAVAFLFASSLMAHVVLRHWPAEPPARLIGTLSRVTWISLVWVVLGGIVRSWFFREYEWLPRAGTAQVPALAVKHLIMFALTGWGLIGVLGLARRGRAARVP